MMKKKNKGGIDACPSCGEFTIDTIDEDFIDHENSIKTLECQSCRKRFKEEWIAIYWEEIK